MEAWGLTIDLVSCIGLELAVGLCVDYAAHVGHTFLVTGPGTKQERALNTVTHIVPAVLYGGFSTLLAVSMLANSEAYTFQAFFKVSPKSNTILHLTEIKLFALYFQFVQIFLLVIIFGLFFGLVFLPVILSYFGPSECHSNSLNEYETTPTDDDRKRRLNKHDDTNSNEKEMISFIQPNENVETDEKTVQME